MTRTSLRSLSSFALLGALSLGPLTACGDDGSIDDTGTGGAAGSPGAGAAGESPTTAQSGSAGSAGAAAGGAGSSGTSGHSGSTSGTGGQAGSAGDSGSTGDSGSAGQAGSAGTSGAAGSAGDTGAAGSAAEGGQAGASAGAAGDAGAASEGGAAGTSGQGGAAGAAEAGAGGSMEAGASGDSGAGGGAGEGGQGSAGTGGAAGMEAAGGTAGSSAGGGQGGESSGGAGQAGDGGSAGSAASECATATDCPGEDSECSERTCIAGVCGAASRPLGLELESAPGDCKKSVCDGEGHVVSQSDDGDPPAGSDCELFTCLLGAVIPVPASAGKACTEDSGHVCDGKGACVECASGGDCASGVCKGNVCQGATCSDGVKNGAETDQDCGGGEGCVPCVTGKQCKAVTDCESGLCSGGQCVAYAAAIGGGNLFTCATHGDGRLKCWGLNSTGQLGLGDKATRGDEPGEMGDALPFVDLGSGRSLRELRALTSHGCLVFDDESLRCWGANNYGQLGLGNTGSRGDGPGEMGNSLLSISF